MAGRVGYVFGRPCEYVDSVIVQLRFGGLCMGLCRCLLIVYIMSSLILYETFLRCAIVQKAH